jgi:hypothetical protein
MPRDRRPHIGEYDAKTNATRDIGRIPARRCTLIAGFPRESFARRSQDAAVVLLPVVFQNLIAGPGQFGPILLQARQNDEVALIDQRTAVALNVARTRRLFLRRTAALRLRLGDRGG